FLGYRQQSDKNGFDKRKRQRSRHHEDRLDDAVVLETKLSFFSAQREEILPNAHWVRRMDDKADDAQFLRSGLLMRPILLNGCPALGLRIPLSSCKNIVAQSMLRSPYFCGEGGIRTLETVSSLPVFETGAFDHSATSPIVEI